MTACNYDPTPCNYDTANEIEATNEEQRLKIAKIEKSNASEISDICNCDKLWLLAITRLKRAKQLRQIVTACNYDTANEIEATNEEQRLKTAKIKKSNAIATNCDCLRLRYSK